MLKILNGALGLLPVKYVTAGTLLFAFGTVDYGGFSEMFPFVRKKVGGTITLQRNQLLIYVYERRKGKNRV